MILSYISQTIGILGGGQLGKMMAMSAIRLGHKVIIYDPEEHCVASQTCHEHIMRPYDCEKSIERFADKCDVITLDNEHIPIHSVQAIESKNVDVFPSSKVLTIKQDRFLEKKYFSEKYIATAPYSRINNKLDLDNFLYQFNENVILKSRRGGYDGKGQVNFRNLKEYDLDIIDILIKNGCIAENFIDFEWEMSVTAVRNKNDIVFYSASHNYHKEGILRKSIVPAPLITPEIRGLALQMVRKIIEPFNYIGAICVEFFIGRDKVIMVNEFACRIHNSTHWTEDACVCSHSEQHIRAITGMPLGSTDRHSDCEMINLIGDDIDSAQKYFNDKNASLHVYGKNETREGRKMGHVTILKNFSS